MVRWFSKLVLGVATVLPLVYMVAFVFGMSTVMDAGPDAFETLFAIHATVMVFCLGLMVGLVGHAVTRKNVPTTEKLLWALILFVGGPLAAPIYWYVRIWRTPTCTDAVTL